MKKLPATAMIAFLVSAIAASAVSAQLATKDEALAVAQSWIRLIIENKGDWGGHPAAEVAWIDGFTRGERLIGYFCGVEPEGYIIVSLRKELAPVKVYSASCDLDPDSNEGMVDFLKDRMEGIIDSIERRFGSLQTVSTNELSVYIEIDYRPVWERLEAVSGDFTTANYQESDELVSSEWHQWEPYNWQCPAPPTGDDCLAPHCVVGCVSLAAAQIMRHWHWPPYGVGSPYNDVYDWGNMPDDVWTSSPTAQTNAVAELCHEIGIANSTNYCGGDSCASGAYHSNMVNAYETNYRYSTDCTIRNRSSYSATDWFNRMKYQFNANRPVHYGIPGHSLVGDGWQEIGGPPPLRQYHMNYGWGGGVPMDDPEWTGYTSSNAWFTLDGLPGGSTSQEDMLEDIYPAQALGSSVSGTYAKQSFPYRYFDQDCTGNSATFQSGQYIQFLEYVVVRCTSTTGGSIKFSGSSSDNTRLFTKGNSSIGALICDGALKLSGSGEIRFCCPHLN